MDLRRAVPPACGLHLPLRRNVLRLRWVLHNLKLITRVRYALEAQHFDGSRWTRAFYVVSAIVEHRAYPAEHLSCDKRVADL